MASSTDTDGAAVDGDWVNQRDATPRARGAEWSLSDQGGAWYRRGLRDQRSRIPAEYDRRARNRHHDRTRTLQQPERRAERTPEDDLPWSARSNLRLCRPPGLRVPRADARRARAPSAARRTRRARPRVPAGLPCGDVERQDFDLAPAGVLEPVGDVVETGVLEPACELEHARVGHRYACQEHAFDHVRPGKPGAGDPGRTRIIG